MAGWLARQWAESAGEFGVAGIAQMVKRIDGPEGWLQYVAKHGARGAKHYQRSGRVPG